jgi:hypothetical protein
MPAAAPASSACEQVDEVRRWLGNYHKLREALESI